MGEELPCSATELAYRWLAAVRSSPSACTADARHFFLALAAAAAAPSAASSAALLLSSDSGSGGTVYTKGPAGTSLHTASSGSSASTTSRMVGRDLGTLWRQ